MVFTSEAGVTGARRLQVVPSDVASTHAVAAFPARGDGTHTTVTLYDGGRASAARSAGGTS